jgi:signal transduction histidine kinase
MNKAFYVAMINLIAKKRAISGLFSNKSDQEIKFSGTAYYEALLQLFLDAYVVINTDSDEIVDFNDKAVAMFEFPVGVNLKGLHRVQWMMRYLAEDSDNKDIMMNGIPDNWYGEAGFITQNKEKFFTFIKSSIYYEGRIKYQIYSIRNITERKIAEKELKIYKDNVEKAAKAKARFLSSMSHELRTPLNGIIGTSNLVLSESNLPENIKQHVNVLRYSSEHMLGIINDILDFSKIDAGKLELRKQSFSLKESIENIIKTFEVQFKNKNIAFICLMDEALDNVNVLSDEVKLSQVINNLLSNALKFTNDGSVTLSVAVETAYDDAVKICFEVIDTGIGIPKEKQSEIFQGFAQVHPDDQARKFGGTGLGLTISERLVTKFGGRLEVESTPGMGTRFHFNILFDHAITHAVKENKGNSITTDMADTNGIRVLVVEDNEINARILISFLKKWGIQIKEAENGIHALELVKYHKFDLILMDLEMPEMDGYTAIKKIREFNRAIPVLAFTATLLENMDSIISETGFNDYVLKPYRPAELKKKILQYAPHRIVDYA